MNYFDYLLLEFLVSLFLCLISNIINLKYLSGTSFILSFWIYPYNFYIILSTAICSIVWKDNTNFFIFYFYTFANAYFGYLNIKKYHSFMDKYEAMIKEQNKINS